MIYQTAKPMVRTTVTISPEYYEQCKKYRIKFSDAMRAGISLLLAEKGVIGYDNKLNIMRKIDILRAKLEETIQRVEDVGKKWNLTNGKKKL